MESFTMTFETSRITPRMWLAIMGMPTSNNYRKMHGGIMDRSCGKRKTWGSRKRRNRIRYAKGGVR